VFDVLLNEPERSPESEIVERLRQRLGSRGLDARVRTELETMVAEADPDAALAAAIRDSGRVVLASNFLFGVAVPTDTPERKGSPMKSAIGVRPATDPPPSNQGPAFTNFPERGVFPPLRARQETFPIPPLLAAAASIGPTPQTSPGCSHSSISVAATRRISVVSLVSAMVSFADPTAQPAPSR